MVPPTSTVTVTPGLIVSVKDGLRVQVSPAAMV